MTYLYLAILTLSSGNTNRNAVAQQNAELVDIETSVENANDLTRREPRMALKYHAMGVAQRLSFDDGNVIDESPAQSPSLRSAQKCNQY
jgi:hypothetical protein